MALRPQVCMSTGGSGLLFRCQSCPTTFCEVTDRRTYAGTDRQTDRQTDTNTSKDAHSFTPGIQRHAIALLFVPGPGS
eukprot:2161364-Rhodomonas_salina.1